MNYKDLSIKQLSLLLNFVKKQKDCTTTALAKEIGISDSFCGLILNKKVTGITSAYQKLIVDFCLTFLQRKEAHERAFISDEHALEVYMQELEGEKEEGQKEGEKAVGFVREILLLEKERRQKSRMKILGSFHEWAEKGVSHFELQLPIHLHWWIEEKIEEIIKPEEGGSLEDMREYCYVFIRLALEALQRRKIKFCQFDSFDEMNQYLQVEVRPEEVKPKQTKSKKLKKGEKKSWIARLFQRK